ncbi:PspC domain-containing protein [Peptoniphilus raoultii]|uniref:PspC domain-containing protein n=1 Tax=Peptoniphilus raoultii TaxID=1776387 RepID=UPI0008DAADEA|nr:PspC domain-containing protein [Peptoniphilus raoultii]
MKKLYRSRNDKVIAGVCGGLAEYFGIDSSVVRIITFLLVFVFGMSIWAYIIAAFIIPQKPDGYEKYEENSSDEDFY